MDNFKLGIIEDDYSVTEVVLPGARIRKTPEYPSEWFRTHPRETIHINSSQD